MQLSNRLQSVVDMVTCSGTVCDVGCDHGYVSIELIKNQVCKKVIAMDVRSGPLERAKEHISFYKLDSYIETRLSDGLEKVFINEADAMICAGMGGRIMQKIFSDSMEKLKNMQEIILQPQSEVPLLRKFLKENGFVIVDENMVLEEGKFYPILKVTQNSLDEAKKPEEFDRNEWDSLSQKYGPWLLKKKHIVLQKYLKQELKSCSEILSKLQEGVLGERTLERTRQVKADQIELERVLEYMKK